MPKAKKTKAVKSAKKVTTKRTPTKAKTKTEDAKLHQAFMNSLSALENYWHKKAEGFKKQVATLQAKLDKANKKTKSKKTTDKIPAAVIALQKELQQAKDALTQAKNGMNKYAQLSKTIRQFERDWLKNLATAKAAKATKTTKATTRDKTAPQEKTKTNKIKPQTEKINNPHLAPLLAGAELGDDQEEIMAFDDDMIKDTDYETIEEMFSPIDDIDSLELMEENPDNFSDEEGYEEY